MIDSEAAELAQWLQRIEAVHPREIELGLDRVAAVYKALSIPKPATVITVAGTNGKGSCVAVMERLLSDLGVACGAFSSPHLLRFNERIRIGGEAVSDRQLCEAFSCIDQARGEIPLTYFEFGTLAALWIFAEQGVDYALLEVGLGGRLDAVNIIDADVAVLSSVDLDHQQWLGDDLETIAREKLGIARSGSALIIGEPRALRAIDDFAAEVATVARLGKDFELNDDRYVESSGFSLAIPDCYFVQPSLACALSALRHTAVAERLPKAVSALQGGFVPGRFQIEQVNGIEVILDVAHNPAASSLLAERLSKRPKAGRCVSLFAVMADKAIDGMVAPMQPVTDAWFLAPLANCERALQADDTMRALSAVGEHMISVSKNMKQAYRRALSLLAEGDRLVVWGSFYTVAEILPMIEKDQRRTIRHEES